MMINDPEIKKPPFSVPEGYFESFPARLMDRIETGREPVIHERSYRTLRSGLAVAATVAALIFAGYAINKLGNDSGRKAQHPQEFADVIEYYIYDFDDETIIAVFNDEADINYLNNIYKEEEIVNYLSEENDLDYSELQDLY